MSQIQNQHVQTNSSFPSLLGTALIPVMQNEKYSSATQINQQIVNSFNIN